MYLLYISKNNLEIFKNKQKLSEMSWTPENLATNLAKIKTTFSRRFRVIISDEFINISSLILTSKEAKKRSSIQSKFQPSISENLSQTIWDYKIVAKINGQKLVQLVVVPQKFFDTFRSAVNASKIKVDLLESFSTTISRFLPPKKLIFLHYQDLIVLVFNQTPIFSQVLKKKLTQSEIDHIFEYSKQRFQTLPQQILFAPTGDIAFNDFDFGNLTPEYTSVDPIKGIIHSANTSGSDASTSRLELPKTNQSKPTFPKVILIIPLFLVVILFVVIFSSKIKSDNSDQIDPSSSITPTISTPTPIPIDVSSLKIKVLNGTGTSGQASEVVELLETKDFSVETTGNASNYDFTQTQIEIKKSISQEIINLLTEALGDNFSPKISSQSLSDSSEFDVIITTGSQ